MPSPHRVPMGLHLPEADAVAVEDLIEQLVHTSRHAVLIACVRKGLETFRYEPAKTIEYLPEGRGRRLARVRAPRAP